MSEPISFDAFFAGVQRELNDGAGTLRITNTETGHSDVYRTGDFIIEAIGQWHKAANLDDRPVKLLVIDQVAGDLSNAVMRK